MILNSPYISGSLTVTGNIIASGSITLSGSVASASYAQNATTSSYAVASTSASYTLNSTNAASASFVDYNSVANKPSLVSSSQQILNYNIFATTSSNTFVGTQTVTGSLNVNGNVTATGQIIAQTLNVQQVTSSVVYSSGSNVFGNNISNTHQFTGSVLVTGSMTIIGTTTFNSNVIGTSARFGGTITAGVLASLNTNLGSNYLDFQNNGSYAKGTTYSNGFDFHNGSSVVVSISNTGLISGSALSTSGGITTSNYFNLTNPNTSFGPGTTNSAWAEINTGTAFNVRVSGGDRFRVSSTEVTSTLPLNGTSLSMSGRINSGGGGGGIASLNAQQLSGDDAAIYSLGVSTAGSSKGIKILAGTNSSDYVLDAKDYVGNTALYIRGDRNVGIGTPNPSSLLHLYNSSSNVQLRVQSDLDQAGLRLIAGSAGTNRASRVDFLNGNASTTVPRWTIINDYSQNGTNDFSIVNSDPSNRVFVINQSGAALFTGQMTIGTNGSDGVLNILGYNSAFTQLLNNSGASGNYNGILIAANANNSNSLPRWDIDLGGVDGITYVPDSFQIRRKPSGGSVSTFLSITNTGAATFSSYVTASSFVATNYSSGTPASPVFSNIMNYGVAGYQSFIQGGNEYNSNTGTYLRFIVNSTEGINTPIYALTLSPYGGAAIFSSSVTASGRITASGSGGSNTLISLNSGNSTQYGWFNAGNGTFVLTNSGVANVGTFDMSTGNYTATSDINKKKDFEPSTLGLNQILSLKPTLYRFKTEGEDTLKHLGFIAQEVKDIIPQAYKETMFDDDETFIGLEYTTFIPVLVKAIQELKAENDTLKEILQRNNIN